MVGKCYHPVVSGIRNPDGVAAVLQRSPLLTYMQPPSLLDIMTRPDPVPLSVADLIGRPRRPDMRPTVMQGYILRDRDVKGVRVCPSGPVYQLQAYGDIHLPVLLKVNIVMDLRYLISSLFLCLIPCLFRLHSTNPCYLHFQRPGDVKT